MMATRREAIGTLVVAAAVATVPRSAQSAAPAVAPPGQALRGSMNLVLRQGAREGIA